MADAPWQRTARAAGLLSPSGDIASTIFAEMTALATRTGAINLGQGFPDFDGPAVVLDAAHRAIRDGVNQYGPPAVATPTCSRPSPSISGAGTGSARRRARCS